MIHIRIEALLLATPNQIKAMEHLVRNEATLEVFKGGFDLPTGYLAFIQTYKDGVRIFGGIGPDGSTST